MAGIPRYTQKIFGLNAGANQMSKYGSFLSTPELYSGATINPDIIQALSNFEGGLYDGVGGAYSPTIQDINSVLRLYSQQLAYLLSRGIPEWDPGTNYNLNDVCKVENNIYFSLNDNNTNNYPVLDPVNWLNKNPDIPNKRIILSDSSGIYDVSGYAIKPKYILVELIGAGGGGAGISLDGSIKAGGDGGDAFFGTNSFPNYISGLGGRGGNSNGLGGQGGTVSISNENIGILTGNGYIRDFPGPNGDDSGYITLPTSPSLNFKILGSKGGYSFLGGGISGFGSGGNGASLESNSSVSNGNPIRGGSGGGAGGGGIALFYNPLIIGPFSYSNGLGGIGGGGVGDAQGQQGNDSLIIVTEFY